MYNGKKVGAVIVAAGESRRMGGIDKMWAPLAGKPVLFWTLSTFRSSRFIDEMVIVLRKEDIDVCRVRINDRGSFGPMRLCSGGERRQDSVMSGLKQLKDCVWAVIHDGARPLVDDILIERGLEAAMETGSAIAAVPVSDTIKESSRDNYVKNTLPRKNLWAVQTPQIFRFDIIIEAHLKGDEEVTDDSTLVENTGHKVKIFNGAYDNIKITTPDDLALAELLLAKREKRIATS